MKSGATPFRWQHRCCNRSHPRDRQPACEVFCTDLTFEPCLGDLSKRLPVLVAPVANPHRIADRSITEPGAKGRQGALSHTSQEVIDQKYAAVTKLGEVCQDGLQGVLANLASANGTVVGLVAARAAVK